VVRTRQSRALRRIELAPRIVAEERRLVSAPRQAALFEAQHEHNVEVTRARAQEVDDGDATGLLG
jgi:hypothetical protein